MEHERRQQRHDEVIAKVEQLKRLPRPPTLLRGGDSIFLSSSAAYPAFVRQQRVLRQETQLQERNNRFLMRQLTAPQQATSTATATATSPTTANLLPVAALKHVTRERQRQWLVFIQVARFLHLPLEAAKTLAIIKLRKLFAPVLRRVRQRIRRKRKMAWILIASQHRMQRPTVDSLQERCGFFRAWPKDALAELLDTALVPGSDSCGSVLVLSGCTVCDVYISDPSNGGGQLGIFSSKQLNAWSAIETVQTRTSSATVCHEVMLGDLSVAAQTQHFKFQLELRCVSAGNTMFWRIPHSDVLSAFKARLSPAQQFEACRAARCAYLELTAPLDISRLSTCLSRWNCTFPLQFITSLAQNLLRPCVYPAGTCLFSRGDRPRDFILIVDGAVVLSSSTSAASEQAVLQNPLATASAPSGVFSLGSASSRRSSSCVRQQEGATTASSSSSSALLKLGPWTFVDLEESLVCCLSKRTRTAVCATDVEAWVADFDAVRRLLLLEHPSFALAIRSSFMRAESTHLLESTRALHQQRLRVIAGLQAARAKELANATAAGMTAQQKQQQLEFQLRLKRIATRLGMSVGSTTAAASSVGSAAASSVGSAAVVPMSPRRPSTAAALHATSSTTALSSSSSAVPASVVGAGASELVRALSRTALFRGVPEEVLIDICREATPFVTLPGDSLHGSVKLSGNSSNDTTGGSGGASFAVLVRGTVHVRTIRETERLAMMSVMMTTGSTAASKDGGGGDSASTSSSYGARRASRAVLPGAMSSNNNDNTTTTTTNASATTHDDKKVAHQQAHAALLKDEVENTHDPGLFLPQPVDAPCLLGSYAALCSGKTSILSTLGGGRVSVTAAEHCCVYWWEVRVSNLREALTEQELAGLTALCSDRSKGMPRRLGMLVA